MIKKGNWKQHAVMAIMLAVFMLLGLASANTSSTASTPRTASTPSTPETRSNQQGFVNNNKNFYGEDSDVLQGTTWDLTVSDWASDRSPTRINFLSNGRVNGFAGYISTWERKGYYINLSIEDGNSFLQCQFNPENNTITGIINRSIGTSANVRMQLVSGKSAAALNAAFAAVNQGQGSLAANQPQNQQPQSQTVQTLQYWTGDGGRNISITILPPQAIGLTVNQSYIPALVQGEFVSNFSTYSAISVLDRQRLDNQYLELFSGYYDDNAAELMDLGRLSPTTHILSGNITRTETGYALQMYATRSADKMTVASYSGTLTFAELDNLSGIRQASFELLQKLGVTLTTRTQEELSRPASANHVSAQTSLAQGITAQRQGDTETALNYFFQASAFDPSLIEAHNRTQILAAYVEGGITFSEPISASITTVNPSNRYTIVLLMPGRVSTSVTSDGSNRAMPNHGADVQWLNADGIRIGGSNGGFNFPYNDQMNLDAGVYNIEVNGRPGIGNTGTYSIKIEYFTEDREPNNTRPTAQVLVSGLTVRGQITAQDGVDMYRYDLTQPGRLTMNVTYDSTGGLNDSYIKWLDANGTQLHITNYYGNTRTEYMDLEAGIYFIELTPERGYTGTYNLRGDFIPAGNNEIEPNNTLAAAQILFSEQTIKGFLSYQDDRDIYRYDLTVPGRLTVNITRDTLENANVQWLDINGTQIRQIGSSSLNPYNISMDLEAGTYFIEIIRSDTSYLSNRTGTYNLRGTFTPAGNNEREPNNTRATAQLLTSGQTVRGSLSLQDDIDMFRFDITQPSRLTLNVTRDSLPDYGAYIQWLDADGNVIKDRGSIYSGDRFPYNQYMDLAAGIYFVVITRYSSNTGTYNFRGDVTAR